MPFCFGIVGSVLTFEACREKTGLMIKKPDRLAHKLGLQQLKRLHAVSADSFFSLAEFKKGSARGRMTS